MIRDRIFEVVALAMMIGCFWLLLWHGIPGHMEQIEKRNAKRWEAAR
jgi:hypothetical protein